MLKQEIEVAGLTMSRLWHCFGTERHRASLDTVIKLLKASGTNVLPINTHHLDAAGDRAALELGFAGVTYDTLGERIDAGRYVKMLNINLRTSADAAVEAAKTAVALTGEKVLKLEVLTPDLKASRDDQVIEAATRLMSWDPSLAVFPLLSCDLAAARAAADAGCGLLRVMGSNIGTGAGITDPITFGGICELPVPVVLDGGVGKPADLALAAKLGADGALVNSVLFDDGRPPETVMADFVAQARDTFVLTAAR
ncbi:thiazole biosynthesis family protein [Amycolatopsis keratiniphila]|uniref:thiazole synthase n=1 Tax=Amycolatopsis keratiniphila TaxID=129921 RepID=R4SLQ8_9PSEU|nr:thiazole biosynthesis family protein [Amycolatopsis keratiniphila]AGM04484.1 thiazole biosynthesis family protein [Amycolatopsis keratiniphila]